MIYLDTSFVGPAFVQEPKSAAVIEWLSRNRPLRLHVSDWLAVEFSSSLARRTRTRDLPPEDAADFYDRFVDWQNAACTLLHPTPEDFRFAATAIRRFETGLRGGDALHLAVAHNAGGLTVMTLDDGMMRAAAMLGIPAQSV